MAPAQKGDLENFCILFKNQLIEDCVKAENEVARVALMGAAFAVGEILKRIEEGKL